MIRRVFSTDHKVIAKQYLAAGVAFLLLGGLLALVIRWQLAYPGRPVPWVGSALFGSDGSVTPATYTALFSTHGLIMVFFAITPMLIGCFGNFCVPLMIGAQDMAFPRLNAASFWVFLISQVLVLASMAAPDPPGAGWTMYAPLSTHGGPLGTGQSLLFAAVFVTGVSAILGAINIITTVITCRAPGMTFGRMPLTVWGLWLTAMLNALFVPVLAVAVMLASADRMLGTTFFSAGIAGQGDPIVYQHLFWLFGHPEVYILILPVWGIVGDLVATFARKPAYWYRGSVFAMISISSMSGLVYGHHLYQSGLGPLAGSAFEALTLSISAPAVVLYVNWMGTLWRGRMRLTVPMWCALGTMFIFGLGGVTGLYLGAISTDIWLHDTMWVVGHFHLIMAAATFVGTFAGLYFWWPKMFGRRLHRGLGTAHVLSTVVLLVATFSLVLAAGYAGQHRRLYDPYQFEFIAGLRGLNVAATNAAFLLAGVQLLFVANVVWSLRRGPKAQDNPWHATTLEWTTTSPPPHDNFEEVPRVHRLPHDYDPTREYGDDFRMQSDDY